MPIIDTQRRMRELGRIRIGQKSDKGAPQKLDRFRFTSASQELVGQVAAAYGGTAAPWTPADGRQQYEVITDSVRIPVLIPPNPVSQWLELWSGGGCQRRCDGQTDTISDQPCICKAEEREQCKPTTRLNVLLRDLPGMGVWRLETHGWNAASELPATAEFAAQANGMIPAFLTLEERVSKSGGQTRKFMVPGLDVDVTPAQLLAGQGAIGQAAPQQVDTPARQQIAAPSYTVNAEHYAELVAAATTRDELLGIREQAKSDGVSDAAAAWLDSLMKARAAELAAERPATATSTVEDSAEVRDRLWSDIMAATTFDTMAELETAFAAHSGAKPDQATAQQMADYLASVQS